MGVQIIFKGCCPGGTALWSRDLGGHPLHRQGPGGVSDPGGEMADGTAPAEDTGWEVEIHLDGGGKAGIGIFDYGGVYQAAAEHSCRVHRYVITIRPVCWVEKGVWGHE